MRLISTLRNLCTTSLEAPIDIKTKIHTTNPVNEKKINGLIKEKVTRVGIEPATSGLMCLCGKTFCPII